ncbi:MAG: hypothetical protein C0494_06370 [Sphingobium sp.]|nr:hypothetical protein [Sphingobium sp.]
MARGGKQPAVHKNVDTADEGGIARYEEVDGRRDLQHRTLARQRRGGQQVVLHRLLFKFKRAHRRRDQARRQRKDARALRSPCPCFTLTQADQG